MTSIEAFYHTALLLCDATHAAQSTMMATILKHMRAKPEPGDLVFEVSSFDRR